MRRLALLLAAFVLAALPARAQQSSINNPDCSPGAPCVAGSFFPTTNTAGYGVRGNGVTSAGGAIDIAINNSSQFSVRNAAILTGQGAGGASTRNGSYFTLDGSTNQNNSLSVVNKSTGIAAQAGYYIGNNTADGYSSLLLNGSGNSTGNGANSLTLNTTGGLFVQTNATNALTIDTSQHVFLTNTTTGTNADVVCLSASGQILIQAAGSCTISSLRFKPDWKPLEAGALAEVMRLAPGSFHMALGGSNADPNGAALQIGLNAENVAAVEPRAALYEDDMATPKSYRPEAIIALLVKGMQEQQAEIAALRDEAHASLWSRLVRAVIP
jgi:hypothetical protein